jgi:hypothetical protein
MADVPEHDAGVGCPFRRVELRLEAVGDHVGLVAEATRIALEGGIPRLLVHEHDGVGGRNDGSLEPRVHPSLGEARPAIGVQVPRIAEVGHPREPETLFEPQGHEAAAVILSPAEEGAGLHGPGEGPRGAQSAKVDRRVLVGHAQEGGHRPSESPKPEPLLRGGDSRDARVGRQQGYEGGVGLDLARRRVEGDDMEEVAVLPQGSEHLRQENRLGVEDGRAGIADAEDVLHRPRNALTRATIRSEARPSPYGFA